MATYRIVRFRFDGDNETIETGLTREEAQAHCRDDDTHGEGWFDGFEAEDDDDDTDDDDTVTTYRASHSTTAQVARGVASGILDDGDAAAIASWYQTPRGHGLTFALLAQGSHVLRGDVLAAIDAEIASGDHGPTDVGDLQALAAWVRDQ